MAEVTRRINQLDYDLLGEAWKDDDVDSIKALWNEQYAILSAALTPEELEEWAARHSWESQLLRELPLELTPTEFTAAAAAEFEFGRRAQAIDDSNDEGRELLRQRYTEREHQIREALGSGERFAEFNRAGEPGYAAIRESAVAPGFSKKEADYIWQLNRWADATAGTLSPDDSLAVITDTLEQARLKLESSTLPSFGRSVSGLSDLIPALREPTPEETLPSIPPFAPDPLNAPLP